MAPKYYQNPFHEPDSHRTLALVVENRKFWVSREILAAYSPVFKNMLYGNFAEARTDTIPLPGKKAKDILEMLLCLIPTPKVKEIDASNARLMLKFADEYQIEELHKRVEKALILKMKGCEKGDQKLLYILRLGSKYKMKELLRECVKRCAMEFDVETLESVFDDLRSEVVACLMTYSAFSPFKLSHKPCSHWTTRKHMNQESDENVRALLDRMSVDYRM